VTTSEQGQGSPPEQEGKEEKKVDSFRCPHCKQDHPLFMTRCPDTGEQIDNVYKMAGRVLETKYRVGRMLGEGGMGVIYAGRHLKIGRKLAIKFLRKSGSSDKQIIERFQNEARMAASVGHRNIVDILDMGQTREGVPYIVMEYLEGNDLGEILDTAVRLPVPLAVDFAVQILSALRAVHEQGIIHRDLKPENVFIVNEAGGGITIKIVDFGVSRLGTADGKPLTMTRTGAVFGTPRYMAPEQARGTREIDRRADIYAVGVILYQMLTGALPFEAEDYNNMIIAITTEEPVHVSKNGVILPDELADIVMRAIAREPADRYATADELIDVIAPFRGAELDDPSISGSIPSIPGWSGPRGATPSVRISDTTGPRLSESGAHANPTLRPDAGVASVDGVWSATGTGPQPSVPPAAGRRSFTGWIVAGIVVAVLAVTGGVAGYIYVRTTRIERQMADIAGAPATAPPPVEETAGPPAPVFLRVDLAGLPEGAEVYVDGTLHPERPLHVAEGAGPREIRITAVGYEPWERQVAIHADLGLTVQMAGIVHVEEEEEEEGADRPKKPGRKDKGKEPGEVKPDKPSKIDTEYPGMQ
jgi:serine/threonine-protein kinase